MSRKCPHCGAEIKNDNANICGTCGKVIFDRIAEKKYDTTQTPGNGAVKKIISLMCVIAAVVFVVWCIRDYSDNKNNSFTTTNNNKTKTTVSNITPKTSSQNKKDELPKIEKTVLYDENGITVTAKNFIYNTSWGGNYEVNVDIENNSEYDISYQSSTILIDDFTFDTYSVGSIYSKCRDTMSLLIDKKEFELSRLKKGFKEIKFSITIDNKTDDTEIAEIDADLFTDYDGEKEQYSFGGTEIYNENGITVYAKENDRKDKTKPFMLYIENDTDYQFDVNYKDIAINSVMSGITYCGGANILPHSKRVTIADFVLIEQNISIVNTVDMVLVFSKVGDYNEDPFEVPRSFASPRITISFE